MVKAMKRIVPKVPSGLRHNPEMTPEAKEVADFALQRIIDVAAGRVNHVKASSVLRASTVLRDETVGPIAKKIEAKVTSLEDLLTESLTKSDEGKPE